MDRSKVLVIPRISTSFQLKHRSISNLNPKYSAPLILLLIPLAISLTGCGGAAFGSMQQGLGGDIAPGYNTPLTTTAPRSVLNTVPTGTFPMIQTSFKLSTVPGNPYNYKQVLVEVDLQKPDGSKIDVPAFYNGDNTWMMRYSPLEKGHYSVANVTLNAQSAHDTELKPTSWVVDGTQSPGFVRINKSNPRRFIFDNGQKYYPLGQDEAWRSTGLPSIPDIFVKMHQSGENWARVWMDYWDGKCLFWGVKPGQINLDAAKQWDQIIDAAQKNDIYVQMTLFHHGEFSSMVNPNWPDNPWNVKNGGFLTSPVDFFTNSRAIHLTKEILFYVLSRWGYSPNVMSYELFNEVQFTNAGRDGDWADIAQWHAEMATFIKQHDLYRHLITTSSAPDVPLNSPIWNSVDYIQVHDYPPDLLSSIGGLDAMGAFQENKPLFIGEFGSTGSKAPTGTGLHVGLWAGIMRFPAGAPEYWSWDNVQNNNLYPQYASVSGFLKASALEEQTGLHNTSPVVTTTKSAPLVFSPGGGFSASKLSTFTLDHTGLPKGLSAYPTYLQGQSHRAMMPSPLTLKLGCIHQTTVTLQVGEVSASGATVEMSSDGATSGPDFTSQNYSAESKNYSPSSSDAILTLQLNPGDHTVNIQNIGNDWATIKQISVSDYVPSLAVYARTGNDYAAGWVYSRLQDSPNAAASGISGTMALPQLTPGDYSITWWNTNTGEPVGTDKITVVKNSKNETIVPIPSVVTDIAFYITRNRIGKIDSKPRQVHLKGSSSTNTTIPVGPFGSNSVH